ncbi:thioredoxin [Rhodococcus sp. Leaf7]|uniref:TlpA family protein disulfide reductase n=1 Tax=unclassified Rhodococcus (in: high G+C Gram-positive bacteria) TaxID=192944 RepID=UPI0006FF2372|nr:MULTISPECIES: TlpA disulfide reductase family protein [unclassified Rhodococcus (in: high G+C Gram-positive bacteria)]KQU07513.1 thioredoxin [Rhodococcus sp. Leaf7]KQU43034.1 thioredoxin [Rhodococcus sp. Leaf247]
MSRSSAARWSLAALVVVVALIVAIWPRGSDEGTGPTSFADYRDTFGTTATDDATASNLAPLRERADLAACPQPAPDAASSGPLAGVRTTCLADGSPVDIGAAIAGRPTVVNLWAYWCGPCAEELPFMAQYAERAAGAVTVLTVHEDPQQGNALARLSDYGVRLPGVQDASASVAAAVGAPAVLPVTVLVAADGTVAKVLPQPFRSVDEIAAAVSDYLGVAA